MTRALLGFAATCLGTLPAVGLACSFALEPGYSGFNPKEFVLYGEVADYAKLEEPVCGSMPTKCGDSWGLRVRVLQAVSAPVELGESVELYEFGLAPNCSSLPVPEAAVRRTPVGTRLRIVATALGGHGPTPPGTVRLLPDFTVPFPQSGDVAADYRAASSYTEWWGSPDYRRWASRYQMAMFLPSIQFELRKDMARLKNAASEKEKYEILARLAEYHWLGQRDVREARMQGTYSALLREYLRDERSIRLLEERFATNQCRAGFLAADQLAAFDPAHDALGNPELQACIGKHLVKRDPERALEWLQRGARSGSVVANFNLGKLAANLEGQAEGARQAKLRSISSTAYRRAATEARRTEQTDPWAPFLLSEMYHDGLGGLKADRAYASFLVCRYWSKRPRDYEPPRWWGRELETCQG